MEVVPKVAGFDSLRNLSIITLQVSPEFLPPQLRLVDECPNGFQRSKQHQSMTSDIALGFGMESGEPTTLEWTFTFEKISLIQPQMVSSTRK